MKRIAIFTHSLGRGGAERAAALLSKMLSPLYVVYVFVIDNKENVYEYSGKLIHIGEGGSDWYEYNLIHYKKLLKIDCTISFLTPLNILNIRTRCNDKIIASERNSLFKQMPPYYHMVYSATKIYSGADAIVSLSKGVQKELNETFGLDDRLLHTIYNFFDKDNILRLSKEKYEPEIDTFIGKSRLIINVGRLHNQKNQSLLIRQISYLVTQGYDLKLIIIGSGVEKDNILKLIDELHIKDRVLVLPYRNNPFPIVKRADIFAFSSKYEGYGNVLMEAMCLGVPVISTDCPFGPREIITGNSDYKEHINGFRVYDKGILVECNEKEEHSYAMAEAIRYILDDKKINERISDAEIKYINCYDNKKLLNEWIDLIEADYISSNNIKGTDYETIALNKTSEIINKLSQKKVFVFGAGARSRRILFKLMDYGIKVENVLVSKLENNPNDVLGIQVCSLKQKGKEIKDNYVVLGVSSDYYDEIYKILTEYEPLEILCIDIISGLFY